MRARHSYPRSFAPVMVEYTAVSSPRPPSTRVSRSSERRSASRLPPKKASTPRACTTRSPRTPGDTGSQPTSPGLGSRLRRRAAPVGRPWRTATTSPPASLTAEAVRARAAAAPSPPDVRSAHQRWQPRATRASRDGSSRPSQGQGYGAVPSTTMSSTLISGQRGPAGLRDLSDDPLHERGEAFDRCVVGHLARLEAGDDLAALVHDRSLEGRTVGLAQGGLGRGDQRLGVVAHRWAELRLHERVVARLVAHPVVGVVLAARGAAGHDGLDDVGVE